MVIKVIQKHIHNGIESKIKKIDDSSNHVTLPLSATVKHLHINTSSPHIMTEDVGLTVRSFVTADDEADLFADR